MRRSRDLKPLSSEHHQALLVAFQLKQGLAGHGESAGAPSDLAGLAKLARRFDEQLMRTHERAEEELIGRLVSGPELDRLREEHAELNRLIEAVRSARPAEARAQLAGHADLLERHVRWEERALFPAVEARTDAATLASVGGELERRLIIARQPRPR